MNKPDMIGGYQTGILGKPVVRSGPEANSLYFNGVDDGVILPVNPVAGWDRFTVEVLFKPVPDGLDEQRFVHFQDTSGNRGLIETRLTPDGNWYLDTYLYNSSSDSGHTLADPEKIHPVGQWFWAALVYDGRSMSHYVNGIEEQKGEIGFGPMEPGEISIGVRLNQVHWFKGAIQEIRFYPEALLPGKLQRVDAR
ncbi:MAG: LamG domain-containing protein [Balneolaceae bacterium]